MTETLYILWALPKGQTDSLHERPLVSFPITKGQAAHVQRYATEDGWHGFRLAEETGKAPDYASTINAERAQ